MHRSSPRPRSYGSAVAAVPAVPAVTPAVVVASSRLFAGTFAMFVA